MPIDANIILSQKLPNLPDYQTMQFNNTRNSIADQTLEQQRMETERQKRALDVQKFLSESLRRNTKLEGDEVAQPPAAQAQATAQTPASAPADNTIHSATVGTDAYGNIIPKVGVESPSGEPMPDFMQPSSTLAAAAQIPSDIPHPYERPGESPEAPAPNSLASAAGAPVSAGPAASATSSPATGTATAATPATAPVAGGYRRPITDWDAVARDMTAAGYGPEALALSKNRQAEIKAALDAQEKQLELTGKRMAQMGAYAGSVPSVNWNETDPGIRQTQVNAAQAAAVTAVKQMAANGLMDPAHVGALLGELSKGYTPQVEQEIQQFAHMAMTSAQQHEAHIADLREAREKLTGEATQAKESSDQERIDRQNAGALLSQARNAQDYAARYATLKPNVQKYFDDPEHYDPEKSSQRAMMSGMTEQGLGNFLNQQDRIKNEEYDRDMRRQQAAERISLERENAADRREAAADRRAGHAQQSSADARQARSELFKLQDQERNLYTLRTTLQNGIASKGAIYVKKNGDTVAMSIAARDSGETPAALLQEMKRRLAQTTDNIASVIGEKNDTLRSAGGEPQVSTEEAVTKLKKGDAAFYNGLGLDEKGNPKSTSPVMGPPVSARGPAPAATPKPNSLAAAANPQPAQPAPKSATPAPAEKTAPAATAPNPPAQKPATQQQPAAQDWIKKIPNFGKSILEPKSKKTFVIGRTYNSPSGPVVFVGIGADGKLQARPLNR